MNVFSKDAFEEMQRKMWEAAAALKSATVGDDVSGQMASTFEDMQRKLWEMAGYGEAGKEKAPLEMTEESVKSPAFIAYQKNIQPLLNSLLMPKEGEEELAEKDMTTLQKVRAKLRKLQKKAEGKAVSLEAMLVTNPENRALYWETFIKPMFFDDYESAVEKYGEEQFLDMFKEKLLQLIEEDDERLAGIVDTQIEVDEDVEEIAEKIAEEEELAEGGASILDTMNYANKCAQKSWEAFKKTYAEKYGITEGNKENWAHLEAVVKTKAKWVLINLLVSKTVGSTMAGKALEKVGVSAGNVPGIQAGVVFIMTMLEHYYAGEQVKSSARELKFNFTEHQARQLMSPANIKMLANPSIFNEGEDDVTVEQFILDLLDTRRYHSTLGRDLQPKLELLAGSIDVGLSFYALCLFAYSMPVAFATFIGGVGLYTSYISQDIDAAIELESTEAATKSGLSGAVKAAAGNISGTAKDGEAKLKDEEEELMKRLGAVHEVDAAKEDAYSIVAFKARVASYVSRLYGNFFDSADYHKAGPGLPDSLARFTGYFRAMTRNLFFFDTRALETLRIIERMQKKEQETQEFLKDRKFTYLTPESTEEELDILGEGEKSKAVTRALEGEGIALNNVKVWALNRNDTSKGSRTLSEFVNETCYGDHAADNLKFEIDDLHLDAGGRYFLFGKSGCGKSRLIDLFLDVNFFAEGACVMSFEREGITYVPQGIQYPSDQTLMEFLAGGIADNDRRFDELLENYRLGVEGHAESFDVDEKNVDFDALQAAVMAFNEGKEEDEQLDPNLTKKEKFILTAFVKTGLFQPEEALKALQALRSESENWADVSFSGGQKCRLAILQALMTNPKMLILDESFNELDEDSKTAIMRFLDFCLPNTIIVYVDHHKGDGRHTFKDLKGLYINRDEKKLELINSSEEIDEVLSQESSLEELAKISIAQKYFYQQKELHEAAEQRKYTNAVRKAKTAVEKAERSGVEKDKAAATKKADAVRAFDISDYVESDIAIDSKLKLYRDAKGIPCWNYQATGVKESDESWLELYEILKHEGKELRVDEESQTINGDLLKEEMARIKNSLSQEAALLEQELVWEAVNGESKTTLVIDEGKEEALYEEKLAEAVTAFQGCIDSLVKATQLIHGEEAKQEVAEGNSAGIEVVVKKLSDPSKAFTLGTIIAELKDSGITKSESLSVQNLKDNLQPAINAVCIARDAHGHAYPR